MNKNRLIGIFFLLGVGFHAFAQEVDSVLAMEVCSTFVTQSLKEEIANEHYQNEKDGRKRDSFLLEKGEANLKKMNYSNSYGLLYEPDYECLGFTWAISATFLGAIDINGDGEKDFIINTYWTHQGKSNSYGQSVAFLIKEGRIDSSYVLTESDYSGGGLILFKIESDTVYGELYHGRWEHGGKNLFWQYLFSDANVLVKFVFEKGEMKLVEERSEKYPVLNQLFFSPSPYYTINKRKEHEIVRKETLMEGGGQRAFVSIRGFAQLNLTIITERQYNVKYKDCYFIRKTIVEEINYLKRRVNLPIEIFEKWKEALLKDACVDGGIPDLNFTLEDGIQLEIRMEVDMGKPSIGSSFYFVVLEK